MLPSQMSSWGGGVAGERITVLSVVGHVGEISSTVSWVFPGKSGHVDHSSRACKAAGGGQKKVERIP